MKEKMLNNVLNLDCLEGLKSLPSESIDLIYLDPPFFTQQKQSLSDKEGNIYSFDDTWADMGEYCNFLKERFIEMKRVLKNTGSIFVHCDKTAAHYIRVVLDEVFGSNNFRSEIIWTYKRWSNAKKGLLNSHQNIYFYSKTNDFKFNTIYGDYSPTTNIDQIYQDRIRDKNGKTKYKTDENGDIVSSANKKGVPLSDTWEIPYLNPRAKERVGYPTQKPVLLLNRIISIATDEGDIVLDPFCGSGTTLVSAKSLKRNYIGFDISENACNISNKRLEEMIITDSDLLKKGKNSYKTKSDYEMKLLSFFDCDIVQRNKGLDAILKEKKDDSYVGIKIQSQEESISESINRLEQALKKRKFLYGIVIKTHSSLIDSDIDIPEGIKIIESLDYQLNK